MKYLTECGDTGANAASFTFCHLTSDAFVLDALLDELRSLLEVKVPINELDMAALPDALGQDELQQLAAVFTQLIYSVNRIVVPGHYENVIRGKCQGHMHTCLRSKLKGDLDIGQVNINPQDILQFKDRLSIHLTSPEAPVLSTDQMTAIKILQNIENMDLHQLPKELILAVRKAHIVVRKKSKNKTPNKVPTESNSSTNKDSTSKPVMSEVSEKTETVSHDVHQAHHSGQSPEDRKVHPRSFKCYICKEKWNEPKKLCKMTPERIQYPRLCQPCAEVNMYKRKQCVDLRGRYAVITGGRIKIGFETAIKMLRDGCHVIITTRFPVDAAHRFSQQHDFELWKERLKVYKLDLRDMNGILQFVSYLKDTIPHLDILVNNAAQTIHRPAQFYDHLSVTESTPLHCLPACVQHLLVTTCHETSLLPLEDLRQPDQNAGCDEVGATPAKRPRLDDTHSEQLCCYDPIQALKACFPPGQLDQYGQQTDMRPTNTWVSVLEEVSVVELLEVLLINTVAPFILTQNLKPLLMRSPAPRRFVVNVSAMEGQFSRSAKTRHHPHTNMAKAALNMMTRTAALGWVEDNIFMTAVDTGWVTDERPFHQAEHERLNKGFRLPLDCVDGAARIYDPIVSGLSHTDIQPHYAVFLKDYKPHPW